MHSSFNPYQSFTHSTPVPHPARHSFSRPRTFSDRYQGLSDAQSLILANIPTTRGSVSSTAQSPQSLAIGGPSLGNATPVAAPVTNNNISEPSMRATVDALTSKTETNAPYENLYPGFDPEEDVEVVPSWTLAICKWGNCAGVRRRLDKMWRDHIFANVKKGKEESHRAEMLAPENRLPNGHVKCLWDGCGRTMPVDGLKKHIEDAHLHVYRLRCIHCGTDKRRDAYRDTHGPASKCRKNPHFQQAASSPSPPLPLPTLETVVFSLNPIGPLPPVIRHTPYPPVAVATESFLEPDPDPNEARSKRSLRSASSPRGPSTDPTLSYQDSLMQKLDKAMYLQSRYSHAAPHADVPTDIVNTIKRPWAQPAVILTHHPDVYRRMPCPPFAQHPSAWTDIRTPAVPHPFTPTSVDPKLLVLRRPTDAAKVVQAAPTSESAIQRRDPNSKPEAGERRDVPVPGGRRMAPLPARGHLPPRQRGDRYEAGIRQPPAAAPLPQRFTPELFAEPLPRPADALDVSQAVPTSSYESRGDGPDSMPKTRGQRNMSDDPRADAPHYSPPHP